MNFCLPPHRYADVGVIVLGTAGAAGTVSVLDAAGVAGTVIVLGDAGMAAVPQSTQFFG